MHQRAMYVSSMVPSGTVRCIVPGADLMPLFEKVVADSPDPSATAESFSVSTPCSVPGVPTRSAWWPRSLSDEASFLSGEVIVVDGRRDFTLFPVLRRMRSS